MTQIITGVYLRKNMRIGTILFVLGITTMIAVWGQATSSIEGKNFNLFETIFFIGFGLVIFGLVLNTFRKKAQKHP